MLDRGERSASRPVRLTSMQESGNPLNKGLGWPQNRSGRFGEKKHFSPMLGFETPDRRTRVLVAIPTASQLPVFHRTHFRFALRYVRGTGARELVIRERNIGVRGAGYQPSRQHLFLVNAMACQLGVFSLPRHGLSTLGHHFNKCTYLTLTFILLPR